MLHEIGNSRPEVRAYFPSFVICAAPKSGGEGPVVLSHWNPARTNIDAIDENLGLNYFWEAISFCRQINAPYFMVRVLKEIRLSEFGAVESAFLRELANKATAGGNSPRMTAQEAESLVYLQRCELELVRGVEGAAREFILDANQYRRPDILYAALTEWLRAPDSWIAEVAALAIAGAAMKGIFS